MLHVKLLTFYFQRISSLRHFYYSSLCMSESVSMSTCIFKGSGGLVVKVSSSQPGDHGFSLNLSIAIFHHILYEYNYYILLKGIWKKQNLYTHQCCLCHVEAVKSWPEHSIEDVMFQILKDLSAQHNCCDCGIFSLMSIFQLLSSWLIPVFPNLNTV
jgi:hypothetical protein